jgi:tRNA-Thr(GGU) m(6)t(6)A37 methyltransferase TsaA
MDDRDEMKIIARIENDFQTKFGIPRQGSCTTAVKSRIIMEPPYRVWDAFRGLEEFSHIWLVWKFSEAVREEWSPTVRPPRLGGNVRKGVFATRSPFRPNPIGLSAVRLERVEHDEKLGPVLYVSGADLMNGTPIYDIKPYLAYADSYPQALGGFTDRLDGHKLKPEISPELLEKIPEEKREALLEVLAEDPRPRYQNDPNRVYGMAFGGMDVHFRVEDEKLFVTDILFLARHQ